MDLSELFRPSLVQRSDDVGLEFQGEEYRFGELLSRARRLARGLGLAPGDRVAVYLANCVELIEIYLAAVEAGWIFTPINVLYTEREIRHILEDAEPSCVFTSAENEALVTAAAGGSQCRVMLVEPASTVNTGGVESARTVRELVDLR